MLIQPIDYFLVVWFACAGGCTGYVGWDQYRNNPEPTVMKWGFILVTLYMGPLGLLLYVLADVEYITGFTFGLFIFQSLFMKAMMGGTYGQNVRKTFLPELISMNFMMAGMAPVMSFLMMGRDMRAMEPTELLFWGVMSVGVMAGFVTAYPANLWMVAHALKHGLMTVRPRITRFDVHARHTSSTDGGETPPASGGHARHGRHGSDQGMTSDATRAQLAAMVGVSAVALVLGVVAPANWVNLRLSARDVGGAMMPRGMIMDRDTPAAAMLDMAAVDPRDVVASFGVDVRGNRELPARIDNGVKVFDLETAVIRWTINNGARYRFIARSLTTRRTTTSRCKAGRSDDGDRRLVKLI